MNYHVNQTVHGFRVHKAEQSRDPEGNAVLMEHVHGCSGWTTALKTWFFQLHSGHCRRTQQGYFIFWSTAYCAEAKNTR